MAAIHSLEFLFRQISHFFSDIRDVFVLLGVIYASKKTIKLSLTIFDTINVYFLCRMSRNCDLGKKFGPWAVITGGNEGIGLTYARELAQKHMKIVLIARSIPRLKQAASSIEKDFGVETLCIAVDFSQGRDIYDTIWEHIKDKEIGVLVNNVGVMYDHPQYFLDVPVERLWQIVNINVAAATMMTHMILPQMVARNRGVVVILSSGACTQITPQMTVYAGTKSFLDYFAQGLRYEYKNKGIVIQSLRPFYVNTRMTSYSKILTSHSFLVPSAETYAKHAVATLGYSGRTTGYWSHTIQMWISSMIPEWLWMWGSSRLNSALRRQALDRKDRMKFCGSMNSFEEVS